MTAYAGPIVDAHHHFWEPRLGKQPWLLPDAAIPFRYGSYESLKADYLPPDLLRDADGFNIVGTVTMETEWNLDDPVGEMHYTQSIADTYGLPNAAVGHTVLNDPEAEKTLEALSEIDIVRAIRHKPGQAATPDLAKSQQSLLCDPQWQQGFSLLPRYGLDFELQVAWWHMQEAYDLFSRFPEIQVTINHAALPSDRSPEGMSGWTQAVRLMAGLPQVAIKISGIGLEGVPWTAANNRQIVETIADAFGPDRIMFASNFPVDGLTGSYQEIFGGFVELTSNWTSAEQQAAFIGNAIDRYRLPKSLLDNDETGV